jgi:hypothetical protein
MNGMRKGGFWSAWPKPEATSKTRMKSLVIFEKKSDASPSCGCGHARHSDFEELHKK